MHLHIRKLLILTSLGLVATMVGAYASGDDPNDSGARPGALAAATADWIVQRVGGDLEATATFNADKGEWRTEGSAIDTPLPEGYPAPTPPGAIDLKKYPSVRRAEISGDDRRSDSGFMPLFRHIQRNDIAMTSPVEMDYTPDPEKGMKGGGWTMSFLYRRPDLHPVGTDGKDARIAIRDAEELVVLSLGGRGSYDVDRIEKDLKVLEAWLIENPEWEKAGNPRALMYNGPSFRPWRKWLEVQIPVKAKAADPAAPAAN